MPPSIDTVTMPDYGSGYGGHHFAGLPGLRDFEKSEITTLATLTEVENAIYMRQ